MRSPTRRRFLRTAAGAAAAAGLPSRLLGRDAGPNRPPNVLLMMCDQLTASVLGCYGGPVGTPHIERFAREGVVFEEATCPTPFCSPTRASMITGLYPHTHGIVANVSRSQVGLSASDVTTGRLLHAAGYNTHQYGKWHLRGSALAYYPDMWDSREYLAEMSETFERVRAGDPSGWMKFYVWALPVEVSAEVRRAVAALGDRWKDQRFADFIAKMGRLKLPLEQHYDVRVADRTVACLRSLDDRPFMVTCSFIAPHDPNVVPSPYYEAFSPADIELPANREVREARFEKHWSRRIVADLGEPSLREFLRIYYGMVKLIDDQVGRILDALDATGRADDTIVVFTTDHGDMAGGHGMVWKSTDAFYDEIARVPLIIRFPGRLAPQRSRLPVSLTDLMPTLLDLTGQPPPGGLQGRSIVPYLTGLRDVGEAPAYTFSERVRRHPKGLREVRPGTPGSFMVRGEGWKYIRYQQGDEYLYHLAEDPGEIVNLAGRPEHAEQQAKLAAELAGWLRETGYPGAA